MPTIRVTCQHCSFGRDVPAEKVPDRPVRVTCPKCSTTFTFHKSPLAEPANVQALLASQPPDAGITASAPTTGATPFQDSVASESSFPPPPPRPPARVATFPGEPVAASKPAHPGLLILLILAVIGAVWLLNFPFISTVPAGAHLDNVNRFAVKAPADWLLITPENYKTIVDKFRDKIPNELAGMIGKSKPGFAVSFLNIPATESEFSPNFNLTVIDTKGKNFPALTDSEKNKATEVISKELSRMLPAYRLLDSRVVQVDGVDSLQIIGEAEITVVTKQSSPIYAEAGAFGMRLITGYTEAEKQTYKIKSIQTMIPGKKRAYALNFMFDDLKTPELATVHSEVLETFKLLERPPRFGGIVMGSLNGGLFGAGLYLFGLLIGRFFRNRE